MSKPNPSIVILAGPNGAGKSTCAPILLRDHLRVDNFVNANVVAQGLAGSGGYRCHLLFLWLSSEALAVSRVRQRVATGGHAVPEATVRRRYRRGLRNFFELYQPLADRWRMLDNSSLVGLRPIAEGRQADVETIHDQDTWKRIRTQPHGR